MSEQTYYSESDPLDGGQPLDAVDRAAELKLVNSGGMAEEAAELNEILLEAVRKHASDLHLKADLPPVMRLDGVLVRSSWPEQNAQQVRDMIVGILTPEQVQVLEGGSELDFAYGVSETCRFRVNVFVQRGMLSAAFRIIRADLPTLDELRLPPVVKELTGRTSGLVLVTGPTGSGKSTTLAAMVDYINAQREAHILTIEDPIEYVFHDKKGMVSQREVYRDTGSFGKALWGAMREDPDVIMVGEMRDLETVGAALTLAETGHLVFGTLHTRSAAQTVDRVIDVFPPEQQTQTRAQLANTLEAVISQLLLPMHRGGRVVAAEIMVATPAARNLIREGKAHQIPHILTTGEAYGMQPMDLALAKLCQDDLVSVDTARRQAHDPENFDRYLGAL